MDSLPIPDYDFDSHYVVEEGKIVSAGPSYKSLCSICVHLARGCPHNCSYCSNSVIQELYPEQSGVIRTRGVESAIKELKYYKEIFPSLNFIWFTEDTMFSRGMKDLKLFAEEYKEKISLPFECYATAKTMNDEKLRLLLNAGLQKLEMGIQSGSENILTTVYNRNISNAQVIWASRIINNYKHEMEPPNYQIIFCNPYEKENDLMATIRLLEKLPVPFYLHVFALCMWPSSRLFKKASLDGLLSKEEKYIDFHAQHLALKINNNEVYLNYILYLIRGDVTSQKMGCLHRNVLKALTKRSLVNFVNKNANISSFVIKKLLDVEYSAIGKACSLRIQRCITFKHKVHRVLKLWKK